MLFSFQSLLRQFVFLVQILCSRNLKMNILFSLQMNILYRFTKCHLVGKEKLVEFTRSCNGFTQMIRIADIGVTLTSHTTLVTKVLLIIYPFLSLDADNLLSWQPITLCWYPAPQELSNDYHRLFSSFFSLQVDDKETIFDRHL